MTFFGLSNGLPTTPRPARSVRCDRASGGSSGPRPHAPTTRSHRHESKRPGAEPPGGTAAPGPPAAKGRPGPPPGGKGPRATSPPARGGPGGAGPTGAKGSPKQRKGQSLPKARPGRGRPADPGGDRRRRPEGPIYPEPLTGGKAGRGEAGGRRRAKAEQPAHRSGLDCDKGRGRGPAPTRPVPFFIIGPERMQGPMDWSGDGPRRAVHAAVLAAAWPAQVGEASGQWPPSIRRFA